MGTHSELVQKNITMATATDPPNTSRKYRNQKAYGTIKKDDPFRTGNRTKFTMAMAIDP